MFDPEVFVGAGCLFGPIFSVISVLGCLGVGLITLPVVPAIGVALLGGLGGLLAGLVFAFFLAHK